MADLILSGSVSGTVTVSAPSAAGSSVLTLPVATDTLIGKATTDTLTNKTLVAPVLGTPTSGALDNCTGTNLCKAWVRFTATATPSITASFNIASVVYSATGIYTITFTNALADANYCVVTGTNYNNAAGSFAYGAGFYSLTASNFVCQTYIVSGVSLLGASGSVYIAVFR